MNKYLFPLFNEETSLPLYIKGVGGLENQDHIIRPVGYFDYQWIHCIKGKGVLNIDGKEYIITKNTGFFMRPGIPHEYYGVEEPWETHWVTFDGIGVPSLIDSLGLKQYGVFNFQDIRSLDSIIYDIFVIAQSRGLYIGYKSSAKLYSLLMELKISIMENKEKSGLSKQKKLQPVLRFIEENCYRNPTIDEMAAVINVSSQYLCRLFSQVLNTRPSMYLNLLKLQKAKEILLLNPNLTVKDVAEEIGFMDPSYFCAIFKKYEALTPMEFRRIHNNRS